MFRQPENAPSAALLGFGYLGRPLAVTLHQNGFNVRALKRRLTSDDINLPVSLDIADLNAPDVFRQPFWQAWQKVDTWICLLPPSSVNDYTGCLKNWLDIAVAASVQHIIFTSSIGIYGNRNDDCNEHTLPDNAPRAQLLCHAEQLFLSSAVPNIDILRLGGLYSGERHPLTSLLTREMPLPNGNHTANMLHQDRAVAALHRAVCTPNGIRIRNLVEQPHPTRQTFYTAEAQKLGLPEPVFTNSNDNGKTVSTLYSDFADLLTVSE